MAKDYNKTDEQEQSDYHVNPDCPLCSGEMFLSFPDIQKVSNENLWQAIQIDLENIPTKAVYCHLCFPNGIVIRNGSKVTKVLRNFKQAFYAEYSDTSIGLIILTARYYHMIHHGYHHIENCLYQYGIPELTGEYNQQWIEARHPSNGFMNPKAYLHSVLRKAQEAIKMPEINPNIDFDRTIKHKVIDF